MAIPYETTGRTRQKARTRGAILDAARELLDRGRTPTVEQAADAAEVSRTTAYRYFPNQRALLVGTFPELDASSLLPDPPPNDPRERFEAVVDVLIGLVLEHETALRAQWRLSLDPAGADPSDLPFRSGRAIAWIEDALDPVPGRIDDEGLRRLVLGTRSAIGIEALAWLTDVAGLEREAAAGQMRWAAHALYRAVVGSSGPGVRAGRPPPR